MKDEILVSMISALVFILTNAEQKMIGRIFNGKEAYIDQFRFMAVLVPKRTSRFGLISEQFICGATIISPNWILTAAHCLDGASKVKVYLGSLTVDDAEIVYKVDKAAIALHPLWDKETRDNDIALLRIPKTMECDKIAFIDLPFQFIDVSHFVLTDLMAITMGWGYTEYRNATVERLQWATMSIMSNSECQNFCTDITENDMCGNSASPFGLPCKGDSGGPLILSATGEQVGITALIPGDNCVPGIPVVFTRVSSYLPWITEITGVGN